MRKIKTYLDFLNESTESVDKIKSLIDQLQTEYPHCEFIANGSKSFKIDYCPIEPEEGSYVTKTEIIVTANINDDNTVNYFIDLISGQYGCDESDEDEWVEPEFDYDISSTNQDFTKRNVSFEDFKGKIIELIEEYCS